MSIIAMKNYPNSKPPGRVYVHDNGLADTYDGKISAFSYVRKLVFTRKADHKIIRPSDQFVLALAWGDNGEKIVDLTIFSNFKSTTGRNWQTNHEVRYLTLREGEIEHDATTCAEGTFIAPAEEMYRWTTKSLKEYAETPPTVRGSMLNHVWKN